MGIRSSARRPPRPARTAGTLAGAAIALLALAAGACAGTATGPAPPRTTAPTGAPEPRGATMIEITTRPLVDLYFLLRSAAARGGGGEAALPAALHPTLAATRAAQEILGEGLLGWGAVDATLAACPNAAELPRCFEPLPERLRVPGGGEVTARPALLALARELATAYPAFVDQVWPEHRRRLEAVRADLAARFEPRLPAALAYHLRSLAIDDPGGTVPVYLVSDLPWPGAVTQRLADGGGVVFVSLADQEGPLLWEILLHELTHAFDLAAGDQDHALARLRTALETEGVERRDPRWRNLPHAVMFVQAGETVRRTLVPDHVHYGEVEGVYRRLPGAGDVVRPAWEAYLDGAATLDQAIRRIVTGVTQAAPAPRTGPP